MSEKSVSANCWIPSDSASVGCLKCLLPVRFISVSSPELFVLCFLFLSEKSDRSVSDFFLSDCDKFFFIDTDAGSNPRGQHRLLFKNLHTVPVSCHVGKAKRRDAAVSQQCITPERRLSLQYFLHVSCIVEKQKLHCLRGVPRRTEDGAVSVFGALFVTPHSLFVIISSISRLSLPFSVLLVSFLNSKRPACRKGDRGGGKTCMDPQFQEQNFEVRSFILLLMVLQAKAPKSKSSKSEI